MKRLQAPWLPLECKPPVLSRISASMDLLASESIGIVPWIQFPYKPAIKFALAHAGEYIFIKFYVSEKDVKTVCTQTNDPVYQDSCVEFFIAFPDDTCYYNFEFNSKGVCLAGYGKGRDERQILPAEIINQVQTLGRGPVQGSDENFQWELCLGFPLTVFCHHQLQDISGKTFTGNFYKCGDHLVEPHFLVWNNILAAEPNFHLPEFFGILNFDPSPLQTN